MNDIYPYYLPGAIPILFIVIFGIPVLFYRLVSTSTKLVEQSPAPEDSDGDPAKIWNFQMEQSQNICRNLYLGFKYKFRHYQIILFVQRMLVVGMSIFGFYFPDEILVIIIVNSRWSYVVFILYIF